jgi:carbonic anhydrase/acetyltransferase-like protein (isoleucine patch superfamily)
MVVRATPTSAHVERFARLSSQKCITPLAIANLLTTMFFMTHTPPNESPDQPSLDSDTVSGILGFRPELVADTAWIAPTAIVRGDVYIGPESSIWFGTVIRGDSAPVRIGSGTNVQDLCCLHADPGFPCIVGDRVTIGHGAIVHGARIEDEALIGIGATVLNGAVIGCGSIVGAGALVPEGKTIPPGSLAVGVPAKVIRSLTPEDQQRLAHGAEHYIELARRYAEQERS